MPDTSSDSSVRRPGRLVAFRYRDFRLFWTGLFISNIGTWMQMTAVNWLLYKLTKSPLQLGINGLFRAYGFGRPDRFFRYAGDHLAGARPVAL